MESLLYDILKPRERLKKEKSFVLLKWCSSWI